MKWTLRVLALGLSLGIGVLCGWLANREPDTQIRSTQDNESIQVYSYYLDRAGKEVRHGWEYTLKVGPSGEQIEDERRFVRGKVVRSSHGIHWNSEDRLHPRPAFFPDRNAQPKNAPDRIPDTAPSGQGGRP